MKKITYLLTAQEIEELAKLAKKNLESLKRGYAKAPSNYGNQSIDALLPAWKEIAKVKAIFQQMEKDGVATVTREPDSYFTFADHCGDCFDPEINNDIDPDELATQRKRELARFNRNGAWYHTLYVLGEEMDSIAGFVGKDFYGSGYDIDFYAKALKGIEQKLPDYHAALIDAVNAI